VHLLWGWDERWGGGGGRGMEGEWARWVGAFGANSTWLPHTGLTMCGSFGIFMLLPSSRVQPCSDGKAWS
jgi:hypothetical protein